MRRSPSRARRAQITRLLVRRAGKRDRARTQALHGEGEIGKARLVRKPLADEANRPRVDYVAAPPCAVPPTAYASHPHRRAAAQRTALSVDIGAMSVRHMRF